MPTVTAAGLVVRRQTAVAAARYCVRVSLSPLTITRLSGVSTDNDTPARSVCVLAVLFVIVKKVVAIIMDKSMEESQASVAIKLALQGTSQTVFIHRTLLVSGRITTVKQWLLHSNRSTEVNKEAP